MMAAGIFVFSAAALLQFFISYCRSLIAASAKQVLSPEVKDVTGIQRVASGEDFKNSALNPRKTAIACRPSGHISAC